MILPWVLLLVLVVVVGFVKLSDAVDSEAVSVTELSEQGAVRYNCELSGGTFENGSCVCSISEGQTQEDMYDKTTGFCQSDIGGSAGDAFFASVGLPYGDYGFWYSIILGLCEQSGGYVSGAACVCPSGLYNETSGLCVQEIEEEPLEYSISQDMLMKKSVSFASGWFEDVAREDVSQKVLDQCASLASQYEGVRQIDYAFAAEVAWLTGEGKDPFDFAWRAHVLPNLSGFQTIEVVVSDFDSCLHEQHINSWPILVSPAWIVFEDQCEGVFDGCIPAREQVSGTLSLKE